MEVFLRLTTKEGKTIYLSASHILGFFNVTENGVHYTKIKMADAAGGYWVVKESPADILNMLDSDRKADDIQS